MNDAISQLVIRGVYIARMTERIQTTDPTYGANLDARPWAYAEKQEPAKNLNELCPILH